MPWVVRDAVDEINRAVGRRRQGLDRLLHYAQLNPLSAPFGTGWATVRCGPDGRCGRPLRCGEAEC